MVGTSSAVSMWFVFSNFDPGRPAFLRSQSMRWLSKKSQSSLDPVLVWVRLSLVFSCRNSIFLQKMVNNVCTMRVLHIIGGTFYEYCPTPLSSPKKMVNRWKCFWLCVLVFKFRFMNTLVLQTRKKWIQTDRPLAHLSKNSRITSQSSLNSSITFCSGLLNAGICFNLVSIWGTRQLLTKILPEWQK